MEFSGHFSGVAEFPVNAFGLSFEQLFDILNQRVDINDWMTGKYRRQAVGETAMDTFARALGEMELKFKPVFDVVLEIETNVESTFGWVTQEGCKKLVRPFFRKQLF